MGATTSAAVGSGAAIEGVVMVMVVWVACSRPPMPLGVVQGNVTFFSMECELFSSLQLEQRPTCTREKGAKRTKTCVWARGAKKNRFHFSQHKESICAK
jgi:hypothetical protein